MGAMQGVAAVHCNVTGARLELDWRKIETGIDAGRLNVCAMGTWNDPEGSAFAIGARD